MIMWNYDASQYNKDGLKFVLIPEGEHPVKILDIRYSLSKTGNDTYVIKIGLLNEPGVIFYHLAFLHDRPNITNQNLGRIYDSFDIPAGEMNPATWIGKIGAAKIKHEIYNNKERAVIEDFLTQERQNELGWPQKEEKEEDFVEDGGDFDFTKDDFVFEALPV